MNLITIIIGIFAFCLGLYTLVIRFNKPEKSEKLQAMKEKFGNKTGIIIHIISYTIIPMLVGIFFIYLGLIGISIF